MTFKYTYLTIFEHEIFYRYIIVIACEKPLAKSQHRNMRVIKKIDIKLNFNSCGNLLIFKEFNAKCIRQKKNNTIK